LSGWLAAGGFGSFITPRGHSYGHNWAQVFRLIIVAASVPEEELRRTFGRWYSGVDRGSREQEEPQAAWTPLLFRSPLMVVEDERLKVTTRDTTVHIRALS